MSNYTSLNTFICRKKNKNEAEMRSNYTQIKQKFETALFYKYQFYFTVLQS